MGDSSSPPAALREGPTPSTPSSTSLRIAAVALELLAAVGAATGAVAALGAITPPTGLGMLYLLAVLVIAIRRGELAGLATAVVSVLTLNYLFIIPRHQLTIAHSSDVVELGVLMIAGVVVGRLAATARRRAAEAESRAEVAAAREREATLLASVASAILAGQSAPVQLQSIGDLLAQATGASHARVVLESAPAPGADSIALPLRSRTRTGWLYVCRDTTWEHAHLERVAAPIGRMVDVVIERERVAARAAEAEAARRAQRASTAILHAISHDLRSPLTAITTAASALGARGVSAAERSELIEAIETEAARLAKLVDDLLDLSRIEAGAAPPRTDWCDLHDVVGCAAASIRSDHPIELAVPVDLPLVRADAAQLERVFCNLIENAVKFSPPEVTVRISAGVGSGRVTVRVTDRGRGIPSQHRSHVFEPFFRGRGDAGGGSGLGLAICHGFVQANGGRIVLQSGEDRGTSFAVSFPLTRQPEPMV